MKKTIIILLVIAAVVGVGLYVRKRMQLAAAAGTKPAGNPTNSNAPLGVVSINVNTARTKLQMADAQAGAEDVSTGDLLS